MRLDQGKMAQGQIQPPGFVNKVLLEESSTHSFVHCDNFCNAVAEQSSWDRI